MAPVPAPKYRLTLSAFCLFALGFALLLVGCAGQKSGAKSPGGNVVERAEGFSERPPWADPNSPFSRRGEAIRVLGYVMIDGEQRMDAGWRAADSYARAELVRFLSTRIVAVLEDTVSTSEAGQISEAITESAHLVIDDLPVVSRYWERTREGSEEKLHLYSRVDLDKTQVQELLQRVWGDKTDIRTPLADVQKTVAAKWDALANLEAVESSADLLPAGIYTPEWAKAGDTESPQDFRFVCHGLAGDEPQALALARRMCTEKLCRLFGVQIKAETKVRETLEGIDVESEVTEGCLDVRLEGRTTEFHGGECGPKGCVAWIQQKYPRAAYLAEKERQQNPTVVERHIVVQEGGIKYKDPAACEAALVRYGAITGSRYEEIRARAQVLSDAKGACQGIDARESGLFLRLTHLLESPVPTFTSSGGGYGQHIEDYYLYTSSKWLEQLRTARFLDQRLSRVQKLLEDALDPLKAIHTLRTSPQDLAAVQAAMKPLYAYPFESRPSFETHSASAHYVHQLRPKGQKDPEFLAFLLHEAGARKHECDAGLALSGRDLISFIALHGTSTQREWQASLKVLSAATSANGSCLYALLKTQPSETVLRKRLDELAGLVQNGSLVLTERRRQPVSQLGSFSSLATTYGLPKEAALDLTLRWQGKMNGTDEEREKLAATMLENYEPKYNERTSAHCNDYLDAAVRLSSEVPALRSEDYEEEVLCGCMKEGFTGTHRKKVIDILATSARRDCDHIPPAEWPGGVGVRAERPDPPANARQPKSRDAAQPGDPANPWDVSFAFKDEVKKCLMDTALTQPANGVLYSWVTLDARATSAGLSQMKVQVRLRTLPTDLRRREGRGLVTRKDMESVERTAESCIKEAGANFHPPSSSPWKSASPNHIWILFSSEDPAEVLVLP